MLAAFLFHWTQLGFNSLISIRRMFCTFVCPKDTLVQPPALDLQAELYRYCLQTGISLWVGKIMVTWDTTWEQPCQGGSWRLWILGMITKSFNNREGFCHPRGRGCEGEQPPALGLPCWLEGREKNGACASAKPFPAAPWETRLQKALSCRVSQGLPSTRLQETLQFFYLFIFPNLAS